MAGIIFGAFVIAGIYFALKYLRGNKHCNHNCRECRHPCKARI